MRFQKLVSRQRRWKRKAASLTDYLPTFVKEPHYDEPLQSDGPSVTIQPNRQEIFQQLDLESIPLP